MYQDLESYRESHYGGRPGGIDQVSLDSIPLKGQEREMDF
jgi:hypothetical protein